MGAVCGLATPWAVEVVYRRALAWMSKSPLMKFGPYVDNCGISAICAANGVDFREPLKPIAPAERHEITFPVVSVIVIIVLLNEAAMCATAFGMFFLTFFLPEDRLLFLLAMDYFFLMLPRFGPLRVRALVCVRWPRTGSLRR